MDRLPALAPEQVQRFVAVAHGDFEQVRALLEEDPALVNAAWDWGGGDVETAMGAAGHTGGVEIVRYLLDRGARPELHASAMMGDLAIVRAMLDAYPVLLHCRGPHGISLLRHAEIGGERAAEVLAYLRERSAGE